ncbi:expressed unknown protein [Seminavis robusta]|uniref:Glycosyltransferase family 92 protein n=1 Tax=Seminavis robusta TaxID=568900 RepID=A0A9N8HNF6_9STRA|nr:expressed unknown protein [Seminavis robusta]|eukprot:Sro816_g206630.1 n/a (576) ;mRNA; f:9052-11044
MSSSSSSSSPQMSISSSSPMGTPSKNKYFFVSTPPSHSPQHQQSQTIWKILRWVLLGFGIGAATMALFQSINMPSIRVEFEYEEGPPPHQVAQQHHKNAFILQSKHNSNKKHLQQDVLALKQQKDLEFAAREEANWNIHNSNNDEAKPNDTQESEQQEEATDEEDPEADNTDQVEEDVDAEGNTETDKKKSSSNGTLGTLKLIKGEMEVEDDDPDFSNPGPPPKLEKGEAFAACILIKDDNHWLIEWLAYHYHTMPLRYLIVAVDPDSKTSPIPILKRWKDRKMMSISVWNDEMFMPKQIKANAGIFNNNTELMMHRVRQNNFYFKCMRTFKQRDREWLMLIDTDEYIVNNYASGLYYNITKNIPITKPGNVLTFIKQHHMLTGENHTCSYMPRYMFGIKESETTMVQRHMPAGMDGMDYLTQRFLYRNPRRMHNGKNLINIRMLPQIKTYTSVHHVSSYCPDPDKMRTVNHVKKSLVRVHHYLGTEEQYFFRSDPRTAKVSNSTDAPPSPDTKKKENSTQAYFTRGKGRYKMLNKRSIYPDQGARAWIRGFVHDVGLDVAKELLAGVGKVGYEE